jgi:hypothetical protein
VESGSQFRVQQLGVFVKKYVNRGTLSEGMSGFGFAKDLLEAS